MKCRLCFYPDILRAHNSIKHHLIHEHGMDQATCLDEYEKRFDMKRFDIVSMVVANNKCMQAKEEALEVTSEGTSNENTVRKSEKESTRESLVESFEKMAFEKPPENETLDKEYIEEEAYKKVCDKAEFEDGQSLEKVLAKIDERSPD
jgi:hypothetical protein